MTDKKTPKVKEEITPSFDLYIKAVLGKKAEDILALDLRGLTSLADAFIICTGSSNRQVTAIAEFIERFMKKSGIKALSVEGKNEGQWVLLDYGDVVIHVFYDTVRQFYDLEGLWSDAKRIKFDELEKAHEQTEDDVNPGLE
ncbi:MAG: ribosome silencing factor [Pseudomonadota bacterium]